MADSEWLDGWNEEFRKLNEEEAHNIVSYNKDMDVVTYHGASKDEKNAFYGKKSAETLQFMKEALESGDGKIPGMQVRYELDTITEEPEGDDFTLDDVWDIYNDRIIINIGDTNPGFLSDMTPWLDCDPKDSFIIRTSDMAGNAESRGIMLEFLDRFMDERIDYYQNELVDYYAPEPPISVSSSYAVADISEGTGLYSPKDSEGNYINVLGKNLDEYKDRFENANKLWRDPNCIRTPEEEADLRNMVQWMDILSHWCDAARDFETKDLSVKEDGQSADLRKEKKVAASLFMNTALIRTGLYGDRDWSAVSEIHVKYEKDVADSVDCDRIMINVTNGEPFKDGAVFTVSPSDLAKDSNDRKIMTEFLERFTDMTVGDVDKRLEEIGVKTVDRNPIPDEWKDMVAGNGIQDTNDKDYGD